MFIDNGKILINNLNTGQILSGLDIGDKTIGIAISDHNLIIASPLKTIERKGGLKDLEVLRNIFKQFNIGAVIIGFPLSLDGNENNRTKKTKEFAKKLANFLPLNIFFQDERFSTDVVVREMKERNYSNKKVKKYVNDAAAAYILQGFIDKYCEK